MTSGLCTVVVLSRFRQNVRLEAGLQPSAHPPRTRSGRPFRNQFVNLHDARPTGGTNGLWVLYALTNVAAIYTHYYAFFLVAAQSLYLAVWWLRNGRRRSVVLAGLATQAATVVAYLPWAGFALNRLAVDESYWEGALSLDFVRKTLLSFASGQTVYEAQAQIITIGYLLLLAVGVVALVVRSVPAQRHGDSLTSGPSPLRGEGHLLKEA